MTAQSVQATAGRKRTPWLLSLRAKLIASHAVVLLLALALVLALSAGFLRSRQEQAGVDRLRQLAIPLALEIGILVPRMTRSVAAEEIVSNLLDYQAEEMNVRLLVFDPDANVLYDTASDQNLVGNTLTPYVDDIAALYRDAQRRGREVSTREVSLPAATDPLGGEHVILAAGGRRRQPRDVVLGIVAQAQPQPLVRQFLPPLLLTVSGSLLVASLAGYALSRRLAAPVDRLTAAADAMATGRLEQRVAGEGPDEIGRLVASFNAMSRQVATTARGQRRLLADIAHELRTPLTSVQGYTRALRDEVIAAPAERQRALATIGDEAERMARLIGQLLDLARLESGQTRLNRRAVAVRPLLARVAAGFAPEAHRRGVRLLIDAPANLAIDGDEDRLQQIVGNLVANALRHTPAAGWIEVRAAPTSPILGSAVGARVTVRDSGEGIAPDYLPRVFERFERGAETGDRVGLGLAIVRELVELHGGTIAVTSEPGAETTFSVDLPGDDEAATHNGHDR